MHPHKTEIDAYYDDEMVIERRGISPETWWFEDKNPTFKKDEEYRVQVPKDSDGNFLEVEQAYTCLGLFTQGTVFNIDYRITVITLSTIDDFIYINFNKLKDNPPVKVIEQKKPKYEIGELIIYKNSRAIISDYIDGKYRVGTGVATFVLDEEQLSSISNWKEQSPWNKYYQV
jgi:hypothetical protein